MESYICIVVGQPLQSGIEMTIVFEEDVHLDITTTRVFKFQTS